MSLEDWSAPLAGVDEAGRGPLAGPVVAAAVILDPDHPIHGLDDSKKLAPRRREVLAAEIRQRAMAVGVAAVEPADIDALNILNATLLAMRNAVNALGVLPATVLVDGNRLPDLDPSLKDVVARALVGGDGLVDAISAASIVAKVTRDAVMERAEQRFPGYGFARHKGYGTRAHLDAIERMGPCPLHRLSFRPFRAD